MMVLLLRKGLRGSPAGYKSNTYSVWSNATLGDSSTIYNKIWHNPDYSLLFPGTILSGFMVHVTDLTAPTSVAWFALGYSQTVGEYTGGGNFNTILRYAARTWLFGREAIQSP